jgi:hypothetical protein
MKDARIASGLSALAQVLTLYPISFFLLSLFVAAEYVSAARLTDAYTFNCLKNTRRTER